MNNSWNEIEAEFKERWPRNEDREPFTMTEDSWDEHIANVKSFLKETYENAKKEGYEDGYADGWEGFGKPPENFEPFLKKEYLRGREEGWKGATEVVRTMAERHYPEDIWIPLPNNGKEILADIHCFLKEKGGGIDAVSAHYVRWVTKNVVKDLEAAKDLPVKKED